MALSQANVLENVEESHERFMEEHTAQELAQQAEAARKEADVACRDLSNAQDQAKKVDSVEGELQQIESVLKEARNKLSID
ncbi:hypothetical protein LTS02_018072 [Friedmanniomyces endolithicus]|nr:hypothetical protein LTS02_018072 [Friedmanniomyces endolithicus]